MASNGYGLNTLPAELLTAFHDVEVSIDFDNRADQDGLRGEGNWQDVHSAIERCRDLGIQVTILACMMTLNYQQMGGLVALARRMGTNLRVNVYQAMHTDRFKLSYEQFWEGYRRLLADSYLISCSEPVVKAVLGLGEARSPCGQQSVRFTPKGEIIPCVYWPDSDLKVDQLPELGLDGVLASQEFQLARQMPAVAEGCRCQGGCASRRALNRNLNAHDDYCPWVRGETIELDFRMALAPEMLRGRNVCTTIVQP
jgi:MoaA/NifB/PqqE/SkfB family radical SAM enzyme